MIKYNLYMVFLTVFAPKYINQKKFHPLLLSCTFTGKAAIISPANLFSDGPPRMIKL